ncbi:velvet factor-domain-containing protein [Fennellomyces sp. T-0311]|nr:velvet factor-domain-containing protein [Fennellomyces sp. T-0311]
MCWHQSSRASVSHRTGTHTASRLDKLHTRKDKSPFYFVVANLVLSNHTNNYKEQELLEEYLVGTTVSSLYRLRDMDNTDGGFFVFGDLSVRKEGDYKLHFSLFEIVEGTVQNRKTIVSESFTVYTTKNFPGPLESTFLSRTFSDQGVKIRIRKETRLQASSKARKRRLDVQALMDNIDGGTAPIFNSHHEKRFKDEEEDLLTPAYASTAADVYFGRWQATPPSPPKSVVSPLSSPPIPSFTPHKEWGERLPPLRAIMTDTLEDDRTLPPLRR